MGERPGMSRAALSFVVGYVFGGMVGVAAGVALAALWIL